MKFGMVAGGPMAGVQHLAKMVEDHGYDSVWTAETGSTAFVQATLAAAVTSKARIGTAIAMAFPRSPAITALTALDIDEVSGGRFILGLGSQVKRVNEERFSTPFSHPAPRMREYAQAVRAFIGGYFGEEPSFAGRFYNITMSPWPRFPQPVRRDIPIMFAAVNERMQQVSGEVADGVIGHPMTSVDYIKKVVLPNIAKGAAKAGRKPDEIELVQQVIISIHPDRQEALREVKQQIGFYATTRTYTPVLATHGFEDVVPHLREAFGQKDMAKLASLVTDEMADTFAIYGEADEVKEKASRFEGLASELTVSGPWYRVEPQRLADNYQSIMQTFAR